jgi:deoxyribonuclease V
VQAQRQLAAERPSPWRAGGAWSAGGCFVCFARGRPGAGRAGDPGWAAAAVMREGRVVSTAVVGGVAGAPYAPGLLALREGPLLETAVRALETPPDVLLVNATGRDHPRGAGLALHLGAVLDLPTVGVTHRPLVARAAEPDEATEARTLLVLDGRPVAALVRVRRGVRPLVAHAAWRTDADTAAEVVLALAGPARTPGPLRTARRLARVARAGAEQGL